MPGMKSAALERLSIRAALALGFCVTLGLWLYTGYDFTRRIEEVEREAAAVAARYMRAQELLSNVRPQVLLSSVRVRDALLNPEPAAVAAYREQIAIANQAIARALDGYVPVMGTGSREVDQIERLRQELEQYHATTLGVLADAAGKSPASVRDLLNRHIVPRREAALGISEEIQGLNRRAFIQEQAEIAEIHRVAELQSRRRLGIALFIGLGIVLLTSVYAGRLEGRLRLQMERDARISQDLQETAAKLLNAQEEERRIIARELHDEVGQVLTAIKVELVLAQNAIEASGGGTPLQEAQTITDGALQTVRNLSQLLHPAALDDLGLPAAIDASLRGLSRRHDIRAELRHVGMAERLPREVEVAAYRIVQEAITNVARHARATYCCVQLTHLPSQLRVEVEDDGVGFDTEAARQRPTEGLGLIGVRERAARLGGQLQVLSRPGHGTRIIVDLPERGAVA